MPNLQHTIPLLLLAASCTSPDTQPQDRWTLPHAQNLTVPAPIDIQLAGPAVRGETVRVRVTLPVDRDGISVFLPTTDGPQGSGICPPQLQGDCLDMVGSLTLYGPAQTTAGVAFFDYDVHPNHPSDMLSLQAVVTTSNSAYLSPALTVPVVSTGEVCDDQVDDDNDELTDCDDPDCATDPWCMDTDLDGMTPAAGDCDDGEATVFLGAEELCSDGLDNDCDGGVDVDISTWYVDLDSDGFGSTAITIDICTSTTGFVRNDLDCNDDDDTLHMRDEDGDGYAPCESDCDDDDAWLSPADVDNDGFSTCDGDCDDGDNTRDPADRDSDGQSTCEGDCNDDNASAYVGATELWYNDTDEACDGGNDYDADGDGFASDSYGGDDCDDGSPEINPDTSWFLDIDADGYGDDSFSATTCDPGIGWTLLNGDCGSSDPNTYPGGIEIVDDGIDQDCNGYDLGRFTVVGAGLHHTCAVTIEGLVECWGKDIDGQVSEAPPGTFTEVSGGIWFSCGLTTIGTVECWGWDEDNVASGVPMGTSFTQVSSGGQHACALTASGSIECWGDNFVGQTSDVPGDRFAQVSAGQDHTCGLTTGGAVECWGSDSYGQVSDAPGGTFTQVSAGNARTCGLTTGGIVECWGSDSYGQVSDAPGGTFTQVSAGDSSTCGITTRNTVECWGPDFEGQVSGAPSGTFTQVSAGGGHSCAVTTDRNIECWGDDEFSQASPP
jgi:alpha-tubulin suppressor-like RCC1 family protein